jgi:hypothetical protein
VAAVSNSHLSQTHHFHSIPSAHNWKLFDPTKNLKAPVTDGIPFGTYSDGIPQYVAIEGTNGLVPGYIVASGARKTGLYTLVQGKEALMNPPTGAYLAKNPDYDYKWVAIRPEDFLANEMPVVEGGDYEDYEDYGGEAEGEVCVVCLLFFA